MAKGRWKDDELAIALRMRKLGAGPSEIGRRLGRSPDTVTSKLIFYDDDGRKIECGRNTEVHVPPHVLACRERRILTSARDQTAAVFGDPLPGYSALDQRAA